MRKAAERLATVLIGVLVARGVFRRRASEPLDPERRRATPSSQAGGPGRSQNVSGKPRGSPRLFWILLGLLLIECAGIVGLIGLRIRAAPAATTFAVAFKSPAPVTQGRGYRLEVAVSAPDCSNPVVLRVTATPSAEFWADNAKDMPAHGRFAFGVEDREASAGDVLPSPTDVIPIQASRLRVTETGSEAGLTVIEGTVRRWDRDRGSIAASFTADWLEPRSGLPILGSSCYLRLPALTGFFAVTPAIGLEVGKLVPHAYTHETASTPIRDIYGSNATLGRNVVEIGEVDAEASNPAPTEIGPEGTSWRCSDTPVTLGTSLEDLRGNGLGDQSARPLPDFGIGPARGLTSSLDSLDQGYSELAGCAATAVIQESTAALGRDLLLLLLGAVLSAGVTSIFYGFRRRTW